jgi:hypothetical protein
VFLGRQVSNPWEEVFTTPDDLDWRHSGVVGGAAGRDWSIGAGFSIGVEAQAVLHFGEQNHAEFNLPVFIRYSPRRLDPLRSVAFGMGPSFATEVPEIEVETRGGSEQLLLYWAIEGEFASPVPDWAIYGRLHHRSNGFGWVADKGGSNVLVIGLRRRW